MNSREMLLLVKKEEGMGGCSHFSGGDNDIWQYRGGAGRGKRKGKLSEEKKVSPRNPEGGGAPGKNAVDVGQGRKKTGEPHFGKERSSVHRKRLTSKKVAPGQGLILEYHRQGIESALWRARLLSSKRGTKANLHRCRPQGNEVGIKREPTILRSIEGE